MSTITIYFSLPFFPLRNKTFFYNGHIALAVNGVVYQIYNPKALRTNFIVSKMPVDDWLFGKSRLWCHNTNSTNQYSHVYLYGCGEGYRTKIYYIQIKDIANEILCNIKHQIENVEERYRQSILNFNILNFNCSLFVEKILSKNKIIHKDCCNLIPSILFKNIVKESVKKKYSFTVGKIDKINKNEFNTHRMCIGIWSTDSEKHMDKIINNFSQHIGGTK